jgi:hypothetical protein
MRFINNILPSADQPRKWTAILISVGISTLLTVWGIYEIGQYGIALFILTPLFMGLSSTVLYGYDRPLTQRKATGIGFLTLGIFTAGLLVFAIEGVICITMAAPFGLVLTWLGSMLGYLIVTGGAPNGQAASVILLLIIPLTAFIEKTNSEQALIEVTTSVDINADIQTVWKNVIEFPELSEPTEALFKVGIAYPISADIDGQGVGAIRNCNFSTGSFVEPITVWNEPNLLAFDVVENPEPMKELSFWDIDAPHLHDYFVSKRGQFNLIQLPNGQVRLEGTTWYKHDIRPEFYWRLWSNYIIHSIHDRVLNHIKEHSEKKQLPTTPAIK